MLYFSKIIALLFLFFSFSYSQIIQFTSPQEAAEFDKEYFLDISWKATGMRGNIKIEYSFNQKNWETIAPSISVKEGSYNWLMPFENDSNMSPDGKLYLKISQTFISDIVSIKIPELASKGKVVFSSKDKSLKDKIIIKLLGSNKTYKVGETISLDPGSHPYQATVKEYGEFDETVIVNAGRTTEEEISIIQTWGSVDLSSKEKDIVVEIRPVPYKRGSSIIKKVGSESSFNLEKGDYKVSVEKLKFSTFDTTFTIDPKINNGKVNIDINMIPTMARVMFETDIAGVEIYEGRYIKKSENDGSYMFFAGKRVVTFKKIGYRSLTKTFDLDPMKKVNNFKVRLVPEHGSVEIESEPPGMAISVDGNPINKTAPYVIDSLAVGYHQFSGKIEGYREAIGSVFVRDNKRSIVTLVPVKKSGDLYIHLLRKNQRINLRVDGDSVGISSSRNPRLVGPIRLDIGPHKIVLSEFGYRDQSFEIETEDYGRDTITADGEMILTEISFNKNSTSTALLLDSDLEDYKGLDLGDTSKISLPFGSYTVYAKAPKHKRKKLPLEISSEKVDPLDIVLDKKTKKDALRWSMLPGAGMLYAEKKNWGLGLLAGTLGSGTLFFLKNQEYKTELDRLDEYEQDYLAQTDINLISESKNRRDSQLEKVNNIALVKDISLISALAAYGLNIGITWRFHGL